MLDTLDDSWADGAWIMVEGINGNIMYKAMMTERSIQTESLSLYSPINKGDTWKLNSDNWGYWKRVDYGDSGWINVSTGNDTKSATGTQYFRKRFTGIENMAAIEIQLKYQSGIVVYMNETEVYRDNMPDGEPVTTTLATGNYSSCDYRGVIRPASGFPVLNILAIEVHFTDANHQENIQFNGFVSFLAGTNSTHNCFVFPVTPIISDYKGYTDANETISWTKISSGISTPSSSLTFDFSGSVSPVSSSFRFWVGEETLTSPEAFTIEGSISGKEWDSILYVTGSEYYQFAWKQWILLSPPSRYPLWKLETKSSHSNRIRIYEFQFLICSSSLPTEITYPQREYSFLRLVDELNIVPALYSFSSCSVEPSLPDGCLLYTSDAADEL